jgi:Glycosyltransferase family 87
VVRAVMLLTSDDPILGADAYTYWSAPYSNPYPGPQLGLPGAYLYPPPFIQALAPLRLLPWEAFHAVWTAFGFGALVFLVGPIGGALAVTLLPFVYRDLLVGNIHLMLGAAIVLGLRYPPVWAFPILTKLTPGIGVLWFAARREWQNLAVAVGFGAAIALVSFVAAPGLWAAWVDRMTDDSGRAGGPYLAILVARVLIGAAIVLYAGWRHRAWLIPIAVVVALPILWPDSLAILLACFPLVAASGPRPRTEEHR